MTSTVLHAVEDDSPKKSEFIQIGKTRHRIASDHKCLLNEIQSDFREMTMEQIFFLTSFIGASLLQVFGPMVLRNVRFRATASKR